MEYKILPYMTPGKPFDTFCQRIFSYLPKSYVKRSSIIEYTDFSCSNLSQCFKYALLAAKCSDMGNQCNRMEA